MPRRVLIVTDKFKGTLTATAAAQAIARGWLQVRPDDSLELLPMTDGGDGFGEVMSGLLGAKPQEIKTVDAAGRPCVGRWWWAPGSKTAIVESATVIGLALLPAKRFHPFDLDTFGLGTVFRAAKKKGARACLVGIGGSATNDGGFGLARAMGWRFRNRESITLEHWTELTDLDRLQPPMEPLVFREIRVAVDVQNPLLGARGATRIYGPQKGLRPQDFPKAEACLRVLARAVKTNSRRELAKVPGAGAAGGLGFGLMAFLDAKLEPGFDLFARHAALARLLRGCDIVVTGEGAIDASTLMGKGVGEVARRCRKHGIPCFGMAGKIELNGPVQRAFTKARALLELTTEAQARKKPAHWLEELARRMATET
jgi:glycerate kinase